MKSKLTAVLLVAIVVACAAQLSAHHSFTATYFEDKKVKIEGKLITFQFRNPHSFVTVEAPDESGMMQRWGVEWGGAGQLGGQGINRYTLKSGDHVIITGSPGRNPEEHRIRMVGLKRTSDGLNWGGKPGETFD